MSYKSSITFLLSLALSCTAFAIPAKKGFFKFKQPDGTEINVRLCGDERLNWFETVNGYKLLRNGDNFLTYAINDEKGNLVPSSLVYSSNESENSIRRSRMNIQKETRFSDNQVSTAMQRMTQENEQIFPLEGKCNLLMLLVNFSDTQVTRDKAEIERMMNEKGYNGIGSFRDFMLENSNNKLDITVTVTDWIQLDNKHDYYYYTDYGSNATELIMDALKKADANIDYSKFDNNKDGVVDGIMVIHEGTGQESSGNLHDIWSHSWNLSYGGYTKAQRTFDGVEINAYTIEPEMIYTGPTSEISSTIGVFCHEFTHNLGAPDFYDSDGASSGGEFYGTSAWDLMAEGSWNGNYGDRPAAINPYQRYLFGWLPEPTVLDKDMEVKNMGSVIETNLVYKLPTNFDKDFFLLENRQKTSSPFEQSIPSNGLVIYHVQENYYNNYLNSNKINSSKKQAVYVVSANATEDPGDTPLSFGYPRQASSVYGYDKNAFNEYTLPSTINWAGEYAQGGIYDITINSDNTVSFSHYLNRKFTVKDIKSSCKNEKITLTWDGPEIDGTTVSGYKVYVKIGDNPEINSGILKEKSLSMTKVKEGKREFNIVMVYGNKKESERFKFEIYIPKECITGASYYQDGSNVNISWTEDSAIKNESQTKFVEYRVYKNGELLGNTTSTSYVDKNASGNSTYQVASYWEGDIELPPVTATLGSGIETAAADSNVMYTCSYDNVSKNILCNFNLDQDSEVTFGVFNSVGQQVAALEGSFSQGNNEVNIAPANGLTNGVYIVVMNIKNNSSKDRVTRKLIVM